MRTGANPAKSGLPAYSPRRLGIATIVYIPIMEGYFANSLEIFQYMLDSIGAATTEEFDLLVFDNGSCEQVVSELEGLHQKGKIDWLMLSRHNLGKAGAWNWIFGGMPNELICYADSDVLFRQGWLEASLGILEAFPQAGMVSAQPNFYDVMEGQGQAHRASQALGIYQTGEYRPAKEIVDEYCLGIGANEELSTRFHAASLPTLIDNTSGKAAVLGASHMQFTIPRQVARQVTPLPSTRALLRKETMSLDYKIDELGYLHLSALQPYVYHMGNTINDRLMAEIGQTAPQIRTQQTRPGKLPAKKGKAYQKWLGRLARNDRLNQYFLRLYNLLFQALNNDF